MEVHDGRDAWVLYRRVNRRRRCHLDFHEDLAQGGLNSSLPRVESVASIIPALAADALRVSIFAFKKYKIVPSQKMSMFAAGGIFLCAPQAKSRSVKDFLRRQSALEPIVNRIAMDFGDLRPLNNIERAPFKSNENIALSIIHLLFACGPSAIFRGIRAVIVDAVQRHLGRWLAHIDKKVFKQVPPLADSDISASVARMTLTPRAHTHPRLMRASIRRPMLHIASMHQMYSGSRFPRRKTSARCASPRAQMILTNTLFFPAIAKTPKILSSTLGLAKHNEPRKSLSNCNRHRIPSQLRDNYAITEMV